MDTHTHLSATARRATLTAVAEVEVFRSDLATRRVELVVATAIDGCLMHRWSGAAPAPGRAIVGRWMAPDGSAPERVTTPERAVLAKVWAAAHALVVAAVAL
jgi:hypothetical protein